MFKKGLLSLICSLMIMLMIPFSISAESGSLSAPFVGWNVHILDIDAEYKQIDRGNLTISPGGVHVTGQLNCSSYHNTGNDSACDIYELENQSNSIVTGLEFHIGNSSITNLTNDEFTGTIYKRIYEVEFVLDASYVGYVTFLDSGNSYTDYVNGSSFKHTFWSDAAETFNITISNYSLYRNSSGAWNFPIESYPWISQLFKYQIKQIDYVPFLSYYIPSFQIENDNTVFYGWVFDDRDYYMSFYVNGSIIESNLSDYFNFGSFTVTEINELNVFHELQLYTLKLRSSITGGTTIKSVGTHKITPLYFGYNTDILSTDFALSIGLENDLLSNIDLLANGNTGSNQSAYSLDDSTSDLTQDIGQYTQIENDFNDDMNSYLNDIDTTNTLPSAMGSKFLTSANWVRVQFNRMTNNTPFGSILGFSLVLGLALLIIGKVYK